MFLSVIFCIVLVMVVGVSSFRILESKTDRHTGSGIVSKKFDGQTGGTDILAGTGICPSFSFHLEEVNHLDIDYL